MEALPVIGKCFTLTQGKTEKDYLLEWQRKCRKDAAKLKIKDEQLPYVGAAIGRVLVNEFEIFFFSRNTGLFHDLDYSWQYHHEVDL